MDKQNVVHINNKVLSMPLKIWHIYNGILFNHKKEGNLGNSMVV